MKKLLFLFAAIMTAATVLFFCGCSGKEMKRVSERRSGYFGASNGVVTVTAVSGVRETPFAADGAIGELKPYTLITVVPVTFDVDAVYTYKASIADYTFGGTLIMHPFAASYSAEVDTEALSDFTVTLACGGNTQTLELKSLVTSEMLGYDKAIDCAETELKPRGEYEIRARMIKNPLGGDGLCWHVMFIAADGSSSVLIDPLTAKIIAKKIE